MQDNQSSGQYDVNDATLKFVTRRDDITLDDDPNILRAEMSCGHAVSPQSLTAWCRSLLDQGQYKFYCPAITHGTVKCNAEWPYLEVRKLAVLNDSEQAHFEENMAFMAATEYCEFKSCPSCESYVERADLTNLCVRCTICTSVNKKSYQFCWQCLREWKGAAAHALRCSYEDCVNPDVDKLTKCTNTRLSYVNNVECPAIRACPTCGLLLEHNGQASCVRWPFLSIIRGRKKSKWLDTFSKCSVKMVPVPVYIDDQEQIDLIYSHLSSILDSTPTHTHTDEIEFIMDVLFPESIIYSVPLLLLKICLSWRLRRHF